MIFFCRSIGWLGIFFTAWRACDQCHYSKTRCERSDSTTDCKRCEAKHKSIYIQSFRSHCTDSISAECSTERPSYRRGAKPGAYKRKSTSHTSIFNHERNYDASDFVNRPEVALTPLPVPLSVPMTNSEAVFESNEMNNSVCLYIYHQESWCQ